MANASHAKVINIDAAIAQLRTEHDTAVEERNSAAFTASANQEDLTLAKNETKAANDAIGKFHACTAALNFFGAGNKLIRD